MDANPPRWFEAIQEPPGEVPAAASRPAPVLFDAQHHAIASPAHWRARREELARDWRRFLGIIQAPPSVPDIQVIETEHIEGATRRLVRYEVESGLPVEAYWLEPAAFDGSLPGAVVLHSTTDETIRQPAGLAGAEDYHIGLHLARRGFIAFCPRNFLWQFGKPTNLQDPVEWLNRRHSGVRGMAKMLFDAQRAVDVLSAIPGVDRTRLGAIGHSLGGKEALYLAAFDPRIRAAVCSEAGIGLSYSNWDAPWYLGPSIGEAGFPMDHGQILAMVAPRAFLLIGGDSADGTISWPYIEEVMPLWRLLGAPADVGLLDHHRGHSLPADARERAYSWLEWHLRAE